MTLCNHLHRHNSIPKIEEFLYLQEICVNGLSLALWCECSCSPTHSHCLWLGFEETRNRFPLREFPCLRKSSRQATIEQMLLYWMDFYFYFFIKKRGNPGILVRIIAKRVAFWRRALIQFPSHIHVKRRTIAEHHGTVINRCTVHSYHMSYTRTYLYHTYIYEYVVCFSRNA